MRDDIGITILALVIVALAATIAVQIRPLHRGRAVLDGLAILPEWRFYAQASLAAASDLARDTHLVVRNRDAAGAIGGWHPVLWPAARRWHHGVWNAQGRIDAVILSMAEDLAGASLAGQSGREVQQSLPYLAVLRRTLAAPVDPAATVDRQFAIVHTVGRAGRSLSLDFLSAWHPR